MKKAAFRRRFHSQSAARTEKTDVPCPEPAIFRKTTPLKREERICLSPYRQPSTTGSSARLSTTGRRAATTGRQATTTGRRTTATGRQATATGRQAATTGQQATTAGRRAGPGHDSRHSGMGSFRTQKRSSGFQRIPNVKNAPRKTGTEALRHLFAGRRDSPGGGLTLFHFIYKVYAGFFSYFCTQNFKRSPVLCRKTW